MGRIYFSFFNLENVKNNKFIIFVNFVPIIFFLRVIYSFLVVSIYKRYIYIYIFFFGGVFFNLLVTRLLQHVESIYDFFYQWVLFLFFCFLLNQRKIVYMIHLDLDSFHDIYNIINEHNQRQSHCLSLIFLTQFHGDIRTQAKENMRRGT